jgi:hypothetical protein
MVGAVVMKIVTEARLIYAVGGTSLSIGYGVASLLIYSRCSNTENGTVAMTQAFILRNFVGLNGPRRPSDGISETMSSTPYLDLAADWEPRQNWIFFACVASFTGEHAGPTAK